MPSEWRSPRSAGFKHLDTFAHIASYSAYLTEVFDNYFGDLLKNPRDTNNQLGTLWLGVGKSAFLYEAAVLLMDYLQENSIERTTLVSDGSHTWMNARRYLPDSLQLFFQ